MTKSNAKESSPFQTAIAEALWDATHKYKGGSLDGWPIGPNEAAEIASRVVADHDRGWQDGFDAGYAACQEQA